MQANASRGSHTRRLRRAEPQEQDFSHLNHGEYEGVSSIGPTDGIYTIKSRIKGFLPGSPIETEHQLKQAADTLDFFATKIDRSGENLSRMTLRAVVRRSLLVDDGESSRRLQKYIEVAIPIPENHSNHLDDHVMVYFGHNNQTRQVTQEDHNRYHQHLQEARASPKSVNTGELLKQIHAQLVQGHKDFNFTAQNGQVYQIEMIEASKVTKQQRQAVTELMKTFDYGPEDVDKIIANQNNRLVVIGSGGNLVGLAVTESAYVPLGNGRNLHIVELTDGVVNPNHRQHNLYLVASLFEVANALISGGPDLIYGETNLESRGVLRTAHHQGRRFSVDSANDVGVGQGILKAHASIDGKLSSLTVTYFDRQMIKELKEEMGV